MQVLSSSRSMVLWTMIRPSLPPQEAGLDDCRPPMRMDGSEGWAYQLL